MADILIRGMEMPKDGKITIQIGADGAVYFVEKCTILAEKYDKSSHAMPLPKGHGRCIDANKLTPDIVNYIAGGYGGTVGSMCTLRGYSQQKIDNAPTILEAEVKEDG